MKTPIIQRQTSLITFVLCVSAALAFSVLSMGCAMQPERGNIPDIKQAQLELTYISGHLGNSMDCPTGPQTGFAPSAGAARDSMMEACDPEAEDCNGIGFLNCEEALVSIVITNVGDVAAKGIEITDLELLDESLGSVAPLEVVSVSRIDHHELTGKLGVQEEMRIIVRFAPPKVNWNFKGHLQIIVATDDDGTAELITPRIDVLSAIAT